MALPGSNAPRAGQEGGSLRGWPQGTSLWDTHTSYRLGGRQRGKRSPRIRSGQRGAVALRGASGDPRGTLRLLSGSAGLTAQVGVSQAVLGLGQEDPAPQVALQLPTDFSTGVAPATPLSHPASCSRPDVVALGCPQLLRPHAGLSEFLPVVSCAPLDSPQHHGSPLHLSWLFKLPLPPLPPRPGGGQALPPVAIPWGVCELGGVLELFARSLIWER